MSGLLSFMDVCQYAKNENETSSPSKDISDQRFLQSHWLINFGPILGQNRIIFKKRHCTILNVSCFSIFMQKIIKNGQTVQKIQQFQESSNLIGRELKCQNLENQNFPGHGVFARNQTTRRHFILGHFQQKLMTQFCTKVQKP